jgi:hypothetical protein
MRFHQIKRARTLSVVLAAISLIAAAAPASAAEDVREVKTRVKITFVAGSPETELFVRGRVRAPEQKCERRRVVKFPGEDAVGSFPEGGGDLTVGGNRFSLVLRDPTPREHYRLRTPAMFREAGRLKCEADVKRFRTPH